MNSNGSSFFGSDWLGAFLIIAVLFGGFGGFGFGNRGPDPDVATKTFVQDAVNNQSIQAALGNIALSSANNNYETAQLLNGQTRDLMQMNYTNQINMVQEINAVRQDLANLGFKMDQCLKKILVAILNLFAKKAVGTCMA